MRYVAIIFAVSVAASLQAAGLEGTSLSTAGNVWTNAVLLPSGTTVHDGDRIETDRGASAILWSRTMGRIEIRSGSDVTLGADHLRLHKGAVAGSAVSVLLGSYTIGRNVDESHSGEGDSSEGDIGEPTGETSADSWFVVSDRGGKQLVAAHRGDVRIERAGMAPVLVPGGSYAVPASEPDKDGRRNQDRDAKDRNDEEKDRKKAGGKSGSQGARGCGRWRSRWKGSRRILDRLPESRCQRGANGRGRCGSGWGHSRRRDSERPLSQPKPIATAWSPQRSRTRKGPAFLQAAPQSCPGKCGASSQLAVSRLISTPICSGSRRNRATQMEWPPAGRRPFPDNSVRPDISSG